MFLQRILAMPDNLKKQDKPDRCITREILIKNSEILDKDELYLNIKDLPSEINRDWFWSYDKTNSVLPDRIIIEHILIYGDLDEIAALFKVIPAARILKVYKLFIKPQDKYKDVKLLRLLDFILPFFKKNVAEKNRRNT